MAHQWRNRVCSIIDRCLRVNPMAQGSALGFPTMEHRWRNGALIAAKGETCKTLTRSDSDTVEGIALS